MRERAAMNTISDRCTSAAAPSWGPADARRSVPVVSMRFEVRHV